MWELGHKEGWASKNWCFWTVVLEKTLESSFDFKEIKAVNPKGNQSWIFIGRTDAEAEAPILGPPDEKNLLIGKDPHAGKGWGQEEKGTTEDEMFGWHHWLNGHEFEQSPGDGKGQGSLLCCSLWGRKESDVIELSDKNKSCFYIICWFTSFFTAVSFPTRSSPSLSIPLISAWFAFLCEWLGHKVWWASLAVLFVLHSS